MLATIRFRVFWSSSLLSRNVKVKIYKTIILSVVLYGCETWSLTLREEHGRRVFENRFLRKIFGPKRDEGTGEWKKLYSKELHNLYSFPNTLGRSNGGDEMGRAYGTHGTRGKSIQGFGGKARRKESTRTTEA
jgi:hypothetical protein